MRTKRAREGELVIDHRSSPGLSVPSPVDPSFPVVAGGDLYESAISVCGHCQTMVVMNPQRTRDRAWCSHCDKYLCDECGYVLAQTLQCQDAERRMDDIQNEIERFGSTALLLGRR